MTGKRSLRNSRICGDITELIGDTPMVRLNHVVLPTADRTACAKLEYFNPVGSIKDRTAFSMIRGAIADGDLEEATTCVEPTSGNTGIALSVFLNLLGYRKPIITAGEQIPAGKRALLSLTTSDMDLAPDDVCPRFPGEGAIAAAFGYKKVKDHFVPYQYGNRHNPEVHYRTTGPEIWEQTEGKITHFVSGVGTGGTVTGAGRFLKERNPDIRVITVEPSEQSHEFYGLRNTEYTMKPDIYDESVVDETLLVDSDAGGVDHPRRDRRRTLVGDDRLRSEGSRGAGREGALGGHRRRRVLPLHQRGGGETAGVSVSRGRAGFPRIHVHPDLAIDRVFYQGRMLPRDTVTGDPRERAVRHARGNFLQAHAFSRRR
jgi:cysteine synthase